MCWLAVDRGIRISERFLDRKKPAWEQLRQTIAEDILDKAWHEHSNAYTAAYGADDLDAASLMIGLMGLVMYGSRFMATIDAIDKRFEWGQLFSISC